MYCPIPLCVHHTGNVAKNPSQAVTSGYLPLEGCSSQSCSCHSVLGENPACSCREFLDNDWVRHMTESSEIQLLKPVLSLHQGLGPEAESEVDISKTRNLTQSECPLEEAVLDESVAYVVSRSINSFHSRTQSAASSASASMRIQQDCFCDSWPVQASRC